MLQRTLNLGILAHVDAGKTTLTERLLHAAGVIDEVGSVDDGTTQTDTLLLERQRGITIRSAVVSFAIGDLTVNLIDTPGHPDFIAEVERALSVLDGAVLVVSAVEGVQSQTRILMRALQRLVIPALVFVNKTDRTGADVEATIQAVAERLGVITIPTSVAHGVGTRETSTVPHRMDDVGYQALLLETLTVRSDQLLSAYVEGGARVPAGSLHGELAKQTRDAAVTPVFVGSAITGAGIDLLMAGIAELLPASSGDPDGPLAARVFKVERAVGTPKLAYLRVFSGTLHARDRVRFGQAGEGRVTALSVVAPHESAPRSMVSAGEVAKIGGLDTVRVGDLISDVGGHAGDEAQFAPPMLEAIVAPADAADRSQLWIALRELEDQDPLIAVRRDEARHAISVSLYGEVQKEVVAATLESEYSLRVTFEETTPICIERPLGTGEAVEYLNATTNPFAATLGLRVEPTTIDSGVSLRLDVAHDGVPLHLFRSVEGFAVAMHGYVNEAAQEGLFGWRVTDCAVTVTACGYGGSDGPPSRRGPAPTFKDFQRLTAVVLMGALERARSIVCQPIVRSRLEIPAGSTGALTAALSRAGATVHTSITLGRFTVIEATLPVIHANDLQRQLPRLTSGEGVLESTPAGYTPVTGTPPTRPRTSASPLNLKEYLASLS
ncbi:MAG TPA: translation factor GTPase family protein [Acidimicrobiales bacterium]|nr:translation factor GTPase family protein [Acidimicrobiales bacterium]